MAISLSVEKDEYIMNHVRSKNLRGGTLFTTDHGSWVFLTKEEHNILKTGKADDQLLGLLKEKGILIDENNIKKIVKEYRKKCRYLFEGVSLHIVIPTLRCNLKCVYCYSKAKGEEEKGYDMDEETAKKTVDFIFQSPSKVITIEFQGGEPLLNFDIIRFITGYAKDLNQKYKKNLSFQLVTNLTLMDDEILDFLMKEKIGISTSLDGNELVHNKNRGEYSKTVNWIKKIKEKYNLSAMMLTTRHSLPYYKEIIDEYVSLKLGSVWIKPVNNLGYAQKVWKEISYSPEEYLGFWKKSLDYIIKLNKDIPLKEHYTVILLKKILLKDCYNFTDLESPCGAALAQLAYDYKGDIYTCDEGRNYEIFKLGTVDNSYRELLTFPNALGIVAASTNDTLICDNCAYKPYCGVCPVCSYAKHGNIVPKLPDYRCKIFKGMFDYVFEKLLFNEEYRKVFLKWVED